MFYRRIPIGLSDSQTFMLSFHITTLLVYTEETRVKIEARRCGSWAGAPGLST